MLLVFEIDLFSLYLLFSQCRSCDFPNVGQCRSCVVDRELYISFNFCHIPMHVYIYIYIYFITLQSFTH